MSKTKDPSARLLEREAKLKKQLEQISTRKQIEELRKKLVKK